MKNRIKLLLFLLISSINFNAILKPYQIVSGGTGGIAIVLSNVFDVAPWIVVFLINIIMFIISLAFLEKETTMGIIISTFIYPIFIRMTSIIPILIIDNTLLLAIISGIISGITIGYIIKMGYSTGGINVLVLLLKKIHNISPAISNFIINSIIIILGLYYFGIMKAIYGVTIILINSLVMKYIIKEGM